MSDREPFVRVTCCNGHARDIGPGMGKDFFPICLRCYRRMFAVSAGTRKKSGAA